MNVKISIILLHFLTIGQHTSRSFGVLANNIDANETQTKLRQISTLSTTSTIVSDTCNDRFCYSPINDTINRNLPDIVPSYTEYDKLKSTSILYGVVKIASQRTHENQCYRELNKIYDGIHRKEIWAIKGLFFD